MGSECTTTEPGSADAAEVTITPETVEVAQDEVVGVDVVNRFGDGSLELRKLVLPTAVEELPISQGPFTLHVECSLTDASRPVGEVVYEDDVVLQGAQPLRATVDGIAAGAVCAVTEPDPGAATVHVVTPREVTIRDGETVGVVATNLFGAAGLTVTKTVDGPGAERYGEGPFEVSLDCSYAATDGGEVPLATVGGRTRALTAENGSAARFAPLLYGSTCRIAETATGGATGSVITDADGVQVGEVVVDSLTEDLELEVTNTFDVGTVEVDKRVVDDGPDRFEVSMACTQRVDGVETGVEIPGGPERVLTAGGGLTVSYEQLPAGARCTLVESDDGGATATTMTPGAADGTATVTVRAAERVRIEVVNEFIEPTPAPSPEGTVAGGGAGSLPASGAPAGLLAALVAGLALLTTGAAMLARRRRRRRTPPAT